MSAFYVGIYEMNRDECPLTDEQMNAEEGTEANLVGWYCGTPGAAIGPFSTEAEALREGERRGRVQRIR